VGNAGTLAISEPTESLISNSYSSQQNAVILWHRSIWLCTFGREKVSRNQWISH
jgi:hypothetical protein